MFEFQKVFIKSGCKPFVRYMDYKNDLSVACLFILSIVSFERRKFSFYFRPINWFVNFFV